MRILAVLLLIAVFSFGDVAGWSDHSIFGSYRLDVSSIT